MGLGELALCTSVLAVGRFSLHLGLPALRTLAFITIVFGNQATTYMNRTRARLWSIAPSRWVVVCSVLDVAVASALASLGLGMTRLPWLVIAGALASAVGFTFAFDLLKVPAFKRLAIV
jgi:H+-transporting ATPase